MDSQKAEGGGAAISTWITWRHGVGAWRIRFATLSLAIVMVVSVASSAAAAFDEQVSGSRSCATGYQVRINSNASYSVWHMWNSGEKYYSNGNQFKTNDTKTFVQSTSWTVWSSGSISWANSDCVLAPV